MTMRIAIVAGEASGDLLGAQLINALKSYFPDAIFKGVAGQQMCAAGAETLFPLEKLSVMGFSEVFVRLPELWRLRRQVLHFMRDWRPDIYIGVDAPDFNLPIETQLRQQGIKTVHCNSPTIWAWRPKRIFKIQRAVDLMLTLFPFESPYYTAQHIPVQYIGHPLADMLPLQPDVIAARKQLSLANDKKIIALMPGSRGGEIKYIGPILLQAAQLLAQRYPTLQFMVPMINSTRLQQFQRLQQQWAPQLPFIYSVGQSHTVMTAADIIILASGTATLEAMLLKKPMVVVYRGSVLSYAIAKRLIKIPYVALPNILAAEKLVPELLQSQATPQNIVAATTDWLENPQKIEKILQRFTQLHQQLRCEAGAKAAAAIQQLVSHFATT